MLIRVKHLTCIFFSSASPTKSIHRGIKAGCVYLYTKFFWYWRGFLYLWLRRLSGVACENIRFSSLFARWGTLGARGLSCRLRPTKGTSRLHARKTSGTQGTAGEVSAQNVPSGEERIETDVSAGYVRGDVGLSRICVLLPNYK